MKKIPYGKHFIDKSDIEAVVKVLESDSLTQGPIISEYEKKFANYVGSKYAVSVSSCSAGLHLSAIALNLKQNDYFVTSPITFVSSAAAGLHIGANVIFCDIDINTINISLDRLEEIGRGPGQRWRSSSADANWIGLLCPMEETRIYGTK